MRRSILCAVGALALALFVSTNQQQFVSAQIGPTDTLDIYWIDVEGGAATLIITPDQESILMDAGWGRDDERDAKRIQDAMTDADIDHIDYFITSHFHRDHVDGLPALANRVPIGQFIDHGDSVEQHRESGNTSWNTYLSVAEGKRRTVQPGDKLRLEGVEFSFVAARRKIPEQPLAPTGPNPHCQGAEPGDDLQGENASSVGYLLSLGAFQFLNLGDMTPNIQHQMACPENRLGIVDLYQIPHHGMRNALSPALTWAVQPKVAVINNGPHKGGGPDSYEIIEQIEGLEDIWMVHRALDTDDAHNTSERLIANQTDEDDCEGYWIRAMVHPDGRSYVLMNGRNHTSRTYVSR
tara:strand:- start:4796 stop:5851 length:1056 start_codon:yes stop_codon:yes gene_type:complete